MTALGFERRNDAQGTSTFGEDVELGELTQDGFLGGRVMAAQPRRGFRAGLDSVLMAAAVDVPLGARVFDLGMGAGVASLCLLSRRPDVTVAGLEIDPALCDLARQNAARNAIADRMSVMQGDARHPPATIPRQSFDHVMTNPPFLDEARAATAPNKGKARATAVDAEGEARWFKTALALLRPKGAITVIHRADALGRLLTYLTPGTGGIEILPLHPAADAPAIRVILTARKGSRAPLSIRPGLVLHEPSGAFTASVQTVLQDGLALGLARR